MIPSPVRCVLFDAVGTLIYADPPVSAVYSTAARAFGLSLDEATLERRFVQAFSEHHACTPYANDWTTSEVAERSRWRTIVSSVFPEIAPCDTLFDRLWNHFAQPTSWRLFGDVADCWRRLSGRGLALGVASNFDERLLAICRGLPSLDRCKHLFVSSRLGWRKPAAQFFHAIEQPLSLNPHELLLVGDDWEGDYLGATAAGWHAFHLDRGHRASAFGAISSLAELA